LHVDREAAADAPAWPARSRRLAQRRQRPAQALAGGNRGVEAFAGRDRVALVEEVAFAHRLRGEAQPLGDPVHLLFVPEGDLHGPEPAEGARGGVVGEHRPGPVVDVRHAVRPRRRRAGGEQHPRAQVGVGAGVADDVDLLGDDAAVALHAGAVAQDERVALGAGHDRLLALPDHPDRPAGPPDQQGEVGLDGHVLLAAEPAAHVGADHPELALGQPEDRGDGGGVLDHLGGDAQGDDPRGVDPADTGLGLEVGMLHSLGTVLALDDHVGRRQRGRRVPAGDDPADQEVALVVHERRARFQSPLGVEDPRQVVVLDVDQLGRLLGDLRGDGGDQGDRLTLVAHAVGGEHRHGDGQLTQPAGGPLEHLVPRHVGGRQHRHHTRQRPRGRHLHAGDACARHLGSHHLAVE
jgi:hypothetical protein